MVPDEQLLASGMANVGMSVFSYVQLTRTAEITVVEAISKAIFEPNRLSPNITHPPS